MDEVPVTTVRFCATDYYGDRHNWPKATPEELAEVAWRKAHSVSCGAVLYPWVCTRPKDHPGMHIALDTPGNVCAKWFTGSPIIQEEEELWS